nr:LysR family transcriptional regulator [Colwellia sp. PAMC 20917]
MHLKRLEYFCQLAMLANFTRAADKIGIAQRRALFSLDTWQFRKPTTALP